LGYTLLDFDFLFVREAKRVSTLYNEVFDGDDMRVALAVLLLSASAFAQTKAAGSACGPKDVTFDVRQDNSQHALAQPETGKALIYIVSQSGLACGPGGWCVMRAGLDGEWVGAFERRQSSSFRMDPYNSYFYISVDPGEHHVCVDGQSGLGDMIALMHFTAEAGKVYYVGIQGAFSLGPQSVAAGYSRFLNVRPLDSDEGEYLIATSPLSVSQAKPPKK
jgi:hypothetical protein